MGRSRHRIFVNASGRGEKPRHEIKTSSADRCELPRMTLTSRQLYLQAFGHLRKVSLFFFFFFSDRFISTRHAPHGATQPSILYPAPVPGIRNHGSRVASKRAVDKRIDHKVPKQGQSL